MRFREAACRALHRRNERNIGESIWVVLRVSSCEVVKEILQRSLADRFIAIGRNAYELREWRIPAQTQAEQEFGWLEPISAPSSL